MNAFREIGIMADRINLPRKILVSRGRHISYITRQISKCHNPNKPLVHHQLEAVVKE